MTDAHRFSSEPEEPDTVARAADRRSDDGALRALGDDEMPTGTVPEQPDTASPAVEPTRLTPLLPRRQNPWLVVDVDGSAAGYGALVWALREAARREATVVAVSVLEEADPDPLAGLGRRDPSPALERLEAVVLRAIAETGVVGRTRTAVLERPVFDALTSAARGADLVVVSAHGKSLLRHAVPRPHSRRLARGA
ncbi:universal stress protein [Geodermatophilus sp. SYSU D00705]